jgi:hypothetical protein
MSLRDAAIAALKWMEASWHLIDSEWGNLTETPDEELAIKNLRAALAEAEKAEPVAWRLEMDQMSSVTNNRYQAQELEKLGGKVTPLFAYAPVNQQMTTELSDEQCDAAIREGGLWSLACAVPQNLARLRGLCRYALAAAKRTPCGECHLQPGERCDICGAQRP